MKVRKIFNSSSNSYEYLYNEDEQELIDIALHNLAMSSGTSLSLKRGVDHEQ